MSRWTIEFENHNLHDNWAVLKEATKELPSRQGMIAEEADEIARLRKVITLIDELITTSDPELVPGGTWDSVNEQIGHVLNQVRIYQSNQDIAHIKKAQSHLDQLIKSLVPYTQKGGQAQAAGRAFSSYVKSIENALTNLSELEKQTIGAISDNEEDSNISLKRIENVEAKVAALDNKLFNTTENSKSLSDKIDTVYSSLTTKYNEISEFYEELTSGDEEESAIIHQIREANERIGNLTEKAQERLDSTEETIKDLQVFYKKIFGQPDRSGNYSGGLRDEINQRKQDLDKFKKTQEQEYSSLVKEINGLLPGAISAGLASAYKDLKESFAQPIINNTRIFYASLTGIFVAMFFLITEQIGSSGITFISADEPADIIKNILYKLPLLVPLIWLAFFSSKRRSEYSRLEQEYAHKEALAKSYNGFKKQVDALQNESDELKELLLASSIKAIALNASETLDGSHKSESPLEKTLDAVTERVAKIWEKRNTDD